MSGPLFWRVKKHLDVLWDTCKELSNAKLVQKWFSHVPIMVFGTISGPKLASFPNQVGNKSQLQIDFVEITIL